MTTSIWFWIAFHIGVFIAIGIDLFASKRRGRELSMRAAFQRTVIWVLVSLAFNAVVWRLKGPHHALDFLTGYLIEYSLSMDNIFVFVLIFAHFRVPPLAQRRVLVWGIVGALIMRGTMILCGIALVQRFHFVLYLFGAFLLITAARMLFRKRAVPDFTEGWLLRRGRQILPITREYHAEHFHDLCDYARPFHRLHVQHLRDSGLAVALLPAGRFDGSLRLLENRTRIRARLCRDQNDSRGLFSDTEEPFTRGNRGDSHTHHGYFDVEDAESGCRRRPKISVAFAVRNHLTALERL